VKLHGCRIELGEIESVLEQHYAVRRAVVVVQENEPDDRRLVAYILPDQEHASPVLQLIRLREQGQLTDKSLYELPNGLVIAHLNRIETEFVYQEIFEANSYLRHGITINEGDCIFDVGANIGLFTLWATQNSQNVEVYAFEPIPPVFELLRLNTEIHSLNVKLFNVGLSDEVRSDPFTYYPYASVLSGRFADAVEEREIVKSVLNQQGVAIQETTVSEEEIDELLVERLKSEQFTCQLRTISDVINEYSIEQIDFLKIDVEKSEMDVLAGILAEDWQKIKQIVVELHNINGRLDKITDLLECHGYDLKIFQDPLLEKTNIYNVYGRRISVEQRFLGEAEGGAVSQRKPLWSSSNLLIKDIRHYLKQKLPNYMVPSAFVLLESLPLMPNGKVDRRAIPTLDQTRRPEGEDTFISPRTPIEQHLADFWQQILGIDKVGIDDSFFDLGGNSLLATQIISRIREAFDVELSIGEFFKDPKIVNLALAITQIQSKKKDSNSNKTSEIQEDEIEHLLTSIEQLSEEEAGLLLKKLSS
jgi:FkbM family methyltransferase